MGVNQIPEELRNARPIKLIGSYSDRRARKQFFKDQELAHDEVRRVPELEKELKNPIRRFYQAPWNKLEQILAPVVGANWANSLRFFIPKYLMGLAAVYGTCYYFKYCGNDWTRKGGWSVLQSKRAVSPGDPEFPRLSDRSKPSDYASKGFNKRKVFLD